MKYISVILFFLTILFAQKPVKIKSLFYYNENFRSNIIPIVEYKDSVNSTKIVFDFDVVCETKPRLEISFYLCDIDGKVYNNPFFIDRGKNSDYLDLESLPVNFQGADYSCIQSFPNKNVIFPFAGKWKFNIIDTYSRKVLEEGFFYVVKKNIQLDLNFEVNYISSTEKNNLFNKALALSCKGELPEGYFLNDISGIEIIENLRLTNSRIIRFNDFNDFQYFEKSLPSGFRAVDRSIQPGNEYRSLDLSNKDFYKYDILRSYIGNPDLVNIYLKREKDRNGIYRTPEVLANDYAKIKLELLSENLIEKEVYIVGSFSNWQIKPEYKMNWITDRYEILLDVKKFNQEYQYVTVNPYTNEISWLELEGNFMETENTYNVFLYFSSSSEYGYDKIIGYKKIVSKLK